MGICSSLCYGKVRTIILVTIAPLSIINNTLLSLHIASSPNAYDLSPTNSLKILTVPSNTVIYKEEINAICGKLHHIRYYITDGNKQLDITIDSCIIEKGVSMAIRPKLTSKN